MTTTVVNIRSLPANWRQDERYVYIGRRGKGLDGPFGNPFRLEASMDRGATIERYRKWLWQRLGENARFTEAVAGLAGKTLVCFCKPAPCHGDVLASAAEYLTTRTKDRG